MMFARGIQYAWIAAALLGEYRSDPQAWRQGMDRLAQEGDVKKLQEGTKRLGVVFQTNPEQVASHLENYFVGTIDYWAAVRHTLGYLPRGYFPDKRSATRVRTAELGAYAHLMKLIAFRIMQFDGVSEWELIRRQAPQEPLPHQRLPESVLRKQGLK